MSARHRLTPKEALGEVQEIDLYRTPLEKRKFPVPSWVPTTNTNLEFRYELKDFVYDVILSAAKDIGVRGNMISLAAGRGPQIYCRLASVIKGSFLCCEWDWDRYRELVNLYRLLDSKEADNISISPHDIFTEIGWAADAGVSYSILDFDLMTSLSVNNTVNSLVEAIERGASDKSVVAIWSLHGRKITKSESSKRYREVGGLLARKFNVEKVTKLVYPSKSLKSHYVIRSRIYRLERK